MPVPASCSSSNNNNNKRGRVGRVDSGVCSVGSDEDAPLETAAGSASPLVSAHDGEYAKRRRLTTEERQQRSRERNRMHAKKTRQRKKAQMDAMGLRVEALEVEAKAFRSAVEERYTAFILLNMVACPAASPAAAATYEEAPPPSLAEIMETIGEGPNSKAQRAAAVVGGSDDGDNAEGGHAAEGDGDEGDEGDEGAGGKRTRRRGKYSQEERETIRRERNRMHAKKTRDRKKVFLEEAEQTIARMERINSKLRGFMVANGMAEAAAAVPLPPPIDAFHAAALAFDNGNDGGDAMKSATGAPRPRFVSATEEEGGLEDDDDDDDDDDE